MRELQLLTRLILKELPVEMIILYGSYARGDYVEFDVRHDFGVRTTFSSDFDILVLKGNAPDELTAERKLDKAERAFGRKTGFQTPVQFLVEFIGTFNQYLSDGRYFYTDILREGILLYDSGKFRLETPRPLKAAECLEQAKDYYDRWFKKGKTFYDYAVLSLQKRDDHFSIFNFHQACECYFHAITLVYTLDKPRQHDLKKLLGAAKFHAPEVLAFFPLDTEEDKRLFEVLKRAYIEARYNPKYEITPEDIAAIRPHVELLGEITRAVCQRKFAGLEELVRRQEAGAENTDSIQTER